MIHLGEVTIKDKTFCIYEKTETVFYIYEYNADVHKYKNNHCGAHDHLVIVVVIKKHKIRFNRIIPVKNNDELIMDAIHVARIFLYIDDTN